MSIFPHKFNRGYTLIELSLIILLIGVILVFVVPKLDSLGDSKLRSAARRLAGLIQSTYDEAVIKKKTYQIVFDISNRTYSLSEVSDAEDTLISDESSKSSLDDKVYIKDITTEEDGKITEGNITLRFYPDGFVNKNTIHISDGKKDYTLVTAPLTGKVRISEGYVEEE